jgi:ceramide glucosyltransferase
VVVTSLLIIFALLTLGAAVFHLLAIIAAIKFKRQRLPASAPPLAFSILKPLKGADVGMYEAFRSHCTQDYSGDYELIFGVSDANDNAIPLVRRLQQQFPARRIELVICEQDLGPNRKVSNLEQMLPHARHPYLLVNDGDIFAPSHYLSTIARAFASRERVGMVTSVYRGQGTGSLTSRLECLGIAADFMPGAVVAPLVEGGVHFAMGSTMAMDRRALEDIGGFHSVIDYLADDYQLAHRMTERGWTALMPDLVVATGVPDYSWKEFFAHQLRWGRTIRASRPGGYAGLAATFLLPWSALLLVSSCAAGYTANGIAQFIAALGLRFFFVELYARWLLQDNAALSWLWLLPLRDAITPIVWAGSIFGNTIVWRGQKFRLRKGKLARADC